MNDIVRIGVVGAGSISVRGIMPHLAQDDVQDEQRLPLSGLTFREPLKVMKIYSILNR